MPVERPPEVTVEHLGKLAIVYLRQSTEFQVNNNTASADYQRNQVRFPRLWGWPEHLVVTEQRDLGASGTTANRAGYQEVLRLIREDRVGAFFIADFTRGGRDAKEWLALVEQCRGHNVLVVIDGRCHDMRISAHIVYTKLMAVVADIENSMRCETMRRARRTRAASGKAVSRIPTGYVKGPEKGTWILDPDIRVQETVRSLFTEYPKAGSIRRAIIALKQKGIRLLVRQRDGGLRDVEPKSTTISSILHNRAYTGEYLYGLTITDPAKTRTRKRGANTDPSLPPQEGKVRRIAAPVADVIVIPNHHPPYVSQEAFEEVQRILKANERNPDHSNLGPSDKLLQGLVRCGLFGGAHHCVMTIGLGWPKKEAKSEPLLRL
jgi:DNA invertase Pin-like site-specific DNA recombinase